MSNQLKRWIPLIVAVGAIVPAFVLSATMLFVLDTPHRFERIAQLLAFIAMVIAVNGAVIYKFRAGKKREEAGDTRRA